MISSYSSCVAQGIKISLPSSSIECEPTQPISSALTSASSSVVYLSFDITGSLLFKSSFAISSAIGSIPLLLIVTNDSRLLGTDTWEISNSSTSVYVRFGSLPLWVVPPSTKSLDINPTE